MAYRCSFSVGYLPPLNTSATRRHWTHAHREVKRWRALVSAHTTGCRPQEPLQRARVTMVRLSSTEPDHDNLAYSFKPVLDALVWAGVLVDDAPANVERVYRWQRVPARRGMVGVLVEELAGAVGEHDGAGPGVVPELPGVVRAAGGPGAVDTGNALCPGRMPAGAARAHGVQVQGADARPGATAAGPVAARTARRDAEA